MCLLHFRPLPLLPPGPPRQPPPPARLCGPGLEGPLAAQCCAPRHRRCRFCTACRKVTTAKGVIDMLRLGPKQSSPAFVQGNAGTACRLSGVPDCRSSSAAGEAKHVKQRQPPAHLDRCGAPAFWRCSCTRPVTRTHCPVFKPRNSSAAASLHRVQTRGEGAEWACVDGSVHFRSRDSSRYSWHVLPCCVSMAAQRHGGSFAASMPILTCPGFVPAWPPE